MKKYFFSQGNITGFLPRWAFLVFGIVVMAYEMISHPSWVTVALTGLAMIIFFALDHFAPKLIPWLGERKENAVAKFENERLR